MKIDLVNAGKRFNREWIFRSATLSFTSSNAYAITGPNGSGKSTLLKIISRIIKPTTGSVRGKGKISSLLEVGTGFHHELTGRENIYNSGYILGMRKQEIQSKFDEIVATLGQTKDKAGTGANVYLISYPSLAGSEGGCQEHRSAHRQGSGSPGVRDTRDG